MDLPFDQRSVRDVEFTGKEVLPAEVHVFHDNFDGEIHHHTPVNEFEPPLIPAEFSLGNMRVIEAVLESMRTSRPVALWRA